VLSQLILKVVSKERLPLSAKRARRGVGRRTMEIPPP
jgi:hypothetical protein